MSGITLESIAKHCIDGNITGPQIAYLLAAQADLTYLRGIEVAVTGGTIRPTLPVPIGIYDYHAMATSMKEAGHLFWPLILDAIADALLEAE